ncbi:DUF2460 domain-containing protein [Novosphingobium flavum]|uniref:DUF2460 domain-containing protein n=1 Tax=Novosphingobium flavum TaxID=1778672 RepID=A0A7X1FQD5_9SPHN|nr:DUF2460 domain-containing protein [Novosphingobium flavum]MBC2665045.1 DUF2460 domain-containing protein [Novosphingobium flavum]
MAFWLTHARDGQHSDWIQRFDPRYWTVNFPRPMMASVVSTGPAALRVDVRFMQTGDLAGLIWDSVDRFDHPLLAYCTDRDYSRTALSFRWRSGGLIALDEVNGPTLTIEGRDASGAARTWYVRLWNYAVSGSPTDAEIVIPFSALDGGFVLPDDADPVHPADIDRMFISLVAPGFVPGGTNPFAVPPEGWAELSAIRCDGERAMLEIGDVIVPPHGIACATAYDDCCNQAPARLLRNVDQLGYRGSLLHYVGMSHFFRLVPADGTFLVEEGSAPICAPARAWHENFLAEAKARDFSPIFSLSYEVLAQHCPDDWQQRASDGTAARTGWSPPSALLSPAHDEAMAWLRGAATDFAAMMAEADVAVRFQVGEPWWWMDAGRRIHLYDDAARAAFGGDPPVIADMGAQLGAAEKTLLDSAGALLAASTAGVVDAVREAAAPASAEVLLLTFLPTVLDPAMPEARRANLPTGWAAPAFDRLQVEDYDWLTGGQDAARRAAYGVVDARLGYPAEAQDYLAGFTLNADDGPLWRRIDTGIDEARARAAHEVFVWALPQICRDGFVRLPSPSAEDDQMQSFDDIPYPLALGSDAAVAPEFSTSIAVTASGFERRNSLWSDARLKFDVGPGVRSESELGTLLSFFRARRGPARGFRLRDPLDHSSNAMTGTPTALDQVLGTGDGHAAHFPLVKRYGEDEGAQVRRITRPEAASVRISVDGAVMTSGWSLDPLGVVAFAAAPAAGAIVRAGFRFDVPVRFAEDQLQLSGTTFAAGEAPSVPVVEIREAA